MNQRLFHIRKGAIGVLAGLMAAGGIAVLSATPASALVAVSSFAATTQPTITTGQAGAAAGNWTFKIPNTFASGNNIEIQITIPGSAVAQTCNTANDNIAFAATPGGTIVSDPANIGTLDTVPVVTSSIATATGEAVCAGASIKDLLTLAISNNSTGTPGDMWDFTISGITYNVGSATPPGAVPAGFNVDSAAVVAFTAASNAVVSAVTVTGNSPAVSLPGSTLGSISNITLTELQAEAVSNGGTADEFVCLTLSGGTWTAPDTTHNTVTASTQTGASAVSNIAAAGAVLSFKATPAGSPTPTTFTVGNASVTSPSAASAGPISIAVTNATSAACTTVATLASKVKVFGVQPAFNRVWGQDAEGTAVAQFEQNFGCDNKVILAQDGYFSDALAASYLAGQLGTGVLLTNSQTLSAETAQAIAQEGVKTVYIVGGPLVVSASIATTLASTAATNCGGAATASMITVQRIYGPTADDTAAAIGTCTTTPSICPTAIGTVNLTALYTTNPYNDTAGSQSSAPSATGSLPTAIVAADSLFQDADAAGALAYNKSFPVLISPSNTLAPQVSTALQNLGIKQVILMGGQFAMQNSVEAAIAALGISVVRVAGIDYTDTAQLLGKLELATPTGSPAGTTTAGFGWDDDANVCVARGDYFADSLGAGPYCGDNTEPVLFTLDPNNVGAYTDAFLAAQGDVNVVTNLNVFGGVLAESANNVLTLQNAVAEG